MIWLLIAIAAVPTLYGLHRLCIRLEDDGYLYYRKKRPRTSGGSMFLPLDQMIRPQIQHVTQIEGQHEKVTEEKDGDQNHS
jgi:hypothetical protein